MKMFNPRLSLIIKVLLIVLAVLLVVAPLGARAGGAGGSSSSSSGFSSGGGGFSSSGGGSSGDSAVLVYLVLQLFRILGPVPSIIILALVAIFFTIASKRRKNSRNSLAQGMKATSAQTDDSKGLDSLIAADPGFARDAFEERVKTSFLAIQDAWQKKDLSGVRKYISDGVYQRFSTQFEMMRLLEQENTLSGITIHKVWLQKVAADADFDTIDVGIRATITDKFVCKSNSSLNSGGTETFIEFWSYIRKRGTQSEHNLYTENTCPACAAPLPADLGERGQCPYCSALVNSGEFDWVLAEITQAEDYGAEAALNKRSSFDAPMRAILARFEDSPIQRVEDAASNAYMQIQSAIVRQKPEAMRRFTNAAYFEKASSNISQASERVVFNRLYLNHVIFFAASEHKAGTEDGQGRTFEKDTVRVAVAIRASYQRAILSGNSSRLIDPSVITHDEVLTFERSASAAGKSKGSLLMHQCSNCGGPIKDSLDLACPYCSAVYNSGDYDWVVDSLVPLSEYRAPKTGTKKAAIKTSDLESMYDVRDYVLLNVMVILAADGHYSPQEREFATRVARELGFRADGLDAIFSQASGGKLGIRMPHQVAKRARIFKMMEKAALADGSIDPREQEILDKVKESYAM